MNRLIGIAITIVVIGLHSCVSSNEPRTEAGVDIVFEEDSLSFSETQKDFIVAVINESEKEVRKLLPTLPDSIQVIVESVDWDLEAVGGVVGRAESNGPPLVMIQISNQYPEQGIKGIYSDLKGTIYHEFHHLVRGWAIQDNKFGPGIPNAMANEGLAVAFAEIYTGAIYKANGYTEEADDWVKEILALPLNASYSDWVMGTHPDGRTSIGYRAGNYLIRKAMAKSDKNILELTELKPEELIKLAGY